MSRSHRVRTHHWRNGRLEVKDRIFGTLYEALAFANSVENADSVKVFDAEDQVTHEISAAGTDTYA
jgi:hypothetical protein